jgi:hypothetical protein
MIGVAVVTIPEGMVNGPDRVLPKNSMFKFALGVGVKGTAKGLG